MDIAVSLSGLLVGFVVGLTGMGGGALMTPVLVLLFGVQPLAAISSDLVASFVMKPVGAAVHFQQGTIHRGLVKALMVGSIPAAFLGAFLASELAGDGQVGDRLKLVLGVALLVASSALALKSILSRQRTAGHDMVEPEPIHVAFGPTVAIGLLGGLFVGLTSVGSGSLMIVMLLLLYPRLSAGRLVGTDLAQAIPLVGAAALGHLIFGQVSFGLTGSLLVGSIPGVYLGAKLSSRAPDRFIRPVLMVVLLATGLKLLGVGLAIAGALSLVGLGAVTLTTALLNRGRASESS